MHDNPIPCHASATTLIDQLEAMVLPYEFSPCNHLHRLESLADVHKFMGAILQEQQEGDVGDLFSNAMN
jgi:hypothetical protein